VPIPHTRDVGNPERNMRGTVVRVVVVLSAAVGLALAFVLPLGLAGPSEPGTTVRMPPATLQTTVSVFPAPGRPESSPDPVLHPSE
jgi:hypothetical protein